MHSQTLEELDPASATIPTRYGETPGASRAIKHTADSAACSVQTLFYAKKVGCRVKSRRFGGGRFGRFPDSLDRPEGEGTWVRGLLVKAQGRTGWIGLGREG